MTTIITAELSRSRQRGQFWNGDRAAASEMVNRQLGQVRYDKCSSLGRANRSARRRPRLPGHLRSSLTTSPARPWPGPLPCDVAGIIVTKRTKR